MIRVRFIKACNGREVGDVVDYDDDSAQHLLDSKVAARSKAQSTTVSTPAAVDTVVETVGLAQGAD